MLWVAYNSSGDLVASAYSYAALWEKIEAAGYGDEEVLVGQVTP